MNGREQELVRLVQRRSAESAERIRGALSTALSQLDDLGKSLLTAEDVAAHAPPPAAAAPDFSALQRVVASIDEERNQVNILKLLLDGAKHYSARTCLFVLRGETFTGWAASGFTGTGSITDERVKSVSIPLSADTVIRYVATSAKSFAGRADQHSQNRMLLDALGGVIPMTLCSFALPNKGRVAAVLYADSGDSAEGLASSDALDILTRAAAMSVELIPVRGKGPAAQAPGTSAATTAPTPTTPAPVAAPAPVPTPRPVVVPAAPVMAAASGPDLAGLPPEEQKLHEAAKRFARLLVSEVKLYNEAKVLDGRKERDLYSRLKEDIDRSRQMYAQRVNPKIAQTTDYFLDELVKTLAEGDRSLLAGYPAK